MQKLTHKQALAIVRERAFKQALATPEPFREAAMTRMFQQSGGNRGRRVAHGKPRGKSKGAHSFGLRFEKTASIKTN